MRTYGADDGAHEQEDERGEDQDHDDLGERKRKQAGDRRDHESEAPVDPAGPHVLGEPGDAPREDQKQDCHGVREEQEVLFFFKEFFHCFRSEGS